LLAELIGKIEKSGVSAFGEKFGKRRPTDMAAAGGARYAFLSNHLTA
jgi:hypothetical protein